MKLLIFIIKWLKTNKHVIKLYEFSERYRPSKSYRYLPLSGLLTDLPYLLKIFAIFQKFYEIFH